MGKQGTTSKLLNTVEGQSLRYTPGIKEALRVFHPVGLIQTHDGDLGLHITGRKERHKQQQRLCVSWGKGGHEQLSGTEDED